ncbi:hypothetical protein [Ponticaulis sp.]|uniref:hypothetical protein n=1 Tax=Ponticaulis sp. TaxID=2020902 RepID=UPI000B664237|nr:hypothetical protein [Ponticaulis sp.]OUY01210.1 MAG: hypothetical protein CBB65_01870 [Hyphomonadaceae bacterium TMED5]|tara:strand:- start:54417 stop:55451 length:1035 start_codon:yes stop_codon:yes gene_type:complete
MDEEIIAHEIELSGTEKITVLKPAIDTLVLLCGGKAAVTKLVKSHQQWETAYEFWTDFYNYVFELGKASDQTFLEKSTQRIQGYKSCYSLVLPMSGRRVLFATHPTSNAAPVRFEFNPSQFNADDISDFKKVWSFISFNELPLADLLVDAKITRLDIAVDILGIRPRDVFVYNEDVWKVWSASSLNRGVETLNFYKSSGYTQSPQVNPKKRANLIVYDKRKEQKAKELTPKFGDRDHTRVELSLRKNCHLTSLSNQPYLFEGWDIRRMKLSNPPLEAGLWQLFLDSARFRGYNAATQLLPDDFLPKDMIDNAEKYLPADLITKDQVWSHWNECVKKSMVLELLE